MLRKIAILFFLLISCARAMAVEAVMWHTVFYLPDPIYDGNLNPYIEAYWQINPRSVHYNHNAAGQIIARIQTDVLIVNDTGKVIKEDHYIYQTRPVDNVDQLSSLNIMELKRYLAVAGHMKMTLKLTDLNDTAKKLTLTDSFTLAAAGEKPFYSGLELIDTFYSSDIKSPFRKHGSQFLPSCTNFVDDYKHSLFYYAELYKMQAIPAESYPLVRSVFVSRKEFDAPYVKFTRNDTFTVQPDTNYCAGKFDVSSLPSGNYYLNVMLTDKKGAVVAQRDLFFQRANLHMTREYLETQKEKEADTGLENVTLLDLNKTFIAKYDLNQVRAILKMLIPMSDEGGKATIEGFLKKPEELYMRYYIYNRFAAINKQDPGAAWKEFTAKIKEVNKLYNSGSTPGYETPRGMMFLRYGAPTDVLTVDNEAGTLPYEIWQYNQLEEKSGKIATNSLMIFYKPTPTSFDYKLLHTTVEGELHNLAWRTFLYPNGQPPVSRADEYFPDKK